MLDVEGTLVSSINDRNSAKARARSLCRLRLAWQVKADSIRKINHTCKDHVPDNAPLDAQAEEAPSDRTHTETLGFFSRPFFVRIRIAIVDILHSV